jgi:Calcineurin-like phosphoesterase
LKKIITIFLLSILLFCTNLYADPTLNSQDSWSIILIPDPQTYIKFDRNQQSFHDMISWIIDSKDELNTKLVLCVGDLVEQNAIPEPDGTNGNQTGDQQWKASKAAFQQLDGVLPYILTMGNHDYGIINAENRETQFNDYFKPTDNPLIDPAKGGILRGMAPNAFSVETLENAYYEYSAPDGRKLLIFSLEFAPRDEILTWAKQVAAQAEYKDHSAVLLTHSYLNSDNKLMNPKNEDPYPLYTSGNYGVDMWHKLIKPSSNFEFVFAGHVANNNRHSGQVGYRVDKNAGDRDVHQMLFNAQREGGGWHGNGGDGWLRILEFMPDGQVAVHTYSPILEMKQSKFKKANRESKIDQFTFKLSEANN